MRGKAQKLPGVGFTPRRTDPFGTAMKRAAHRMAKEAKEQRFLTSAGYARSFSEMLQRSGVELRTLGNESLRRSRPPRSSVGFR